jgi:hypothetical protein
MGYFHISADYSEKGAVFGPLENFEEDFLLDDGAPLSDRFSKDAAFRMKKEFPDQVAVYDFLHNSAKVLLVSEAARGFFEDAKLAHVEYLKVALINHKGRKVKEPYFIVHSFPRVDCVDPKKTKHRLNMIDKEAWIDVSDVTLVPSKIKPDFQLFMATHVPWLRLIRDDLAAKLQKTKLRGYTLSDPAKFTF